MDEQILLNLSVLNFIAASLIPLAVALITKAKASSRFKAIANLALVVITSAVMYAIDQDGAVTLSGVMSTMIATYLTASVTYNNFWKPTGVVSTLAEVAPTSGLGTAVVDPFAPSRTQMGNTLVGGEVVSPPGDVPPQD